MRSRPFGALDRQVPVVGQGTYGLEQADRRRATAALRLGLDRGMTHVDTAELYGDGAVEEILGEILDGRRDEVFLVSKVLPRKADRRGVERACEASLRRLRTDRLDLYLLHWLGPHPLAETVAGFEALRAAGKIGAWGVSNLDETRLAEILELCGDDPSHGLPVCDQVLYHLGERRIEHDVAGFCARHGIAVVAYSPFGSGDFPAAESPGGRVLADVARRRGATPRQVALAFLLRLPGAFVIPRAFDPDHVADNAAAADLELGADEIASLDAAFPCAPRTGGVPLL